MILQSRLYVKGNFPSRYVWLRQIRNSGPNFQKELYFPQEFIYQVLFRQPGHPTLRAASGSQRSEMHLVTLDPWRNELRNEIFTMCHWFYNGSPTMSIKWLQKKWKFLLPSSSLLKKMFFPEKDRQIATKL